MKDLHSKIAYLQGLTEGINLDTTTKEGKILVNILDILELMAQEIEEVKASQVEMESYLESIDEDLAELEDNYYEDEEDDEDIEYMEVECPNCHEIVYFDADLLNNTDEMIEICCPNCDEVVYTVDEQLDKEEEIQG